MLEEGQRLFHGHVQDLRNVLPLIAHLQSLAVVAFAAADLAGYVDVSQEMHLDLNDAVARAGFAAPAPHVEAEAPLLVASCLCVGRLREEVADQVEGAGIGRRVRAGRPADRGLIDGDDLVDPVQAVDAVALAGFDLRAVQHPRRVLVQDLVDERALARTGNTGHAGENACREGHVDVL